jgi:2-amino-4-hydroxy-6-hydroxymethyldihydropteridine diphosphokinase
MRAWLGLGANLQQPERQLKLALENLGKAKDISVLEVSSFYRSKPWGDEQQDDFINAVTLIETSLEPLALLHLLQSIENDMGRYRDGRRWGPRVIDIDLLLYGQQSIQSPELKVPHPHMHERAFVLQPLLELDPGLEIPGRGGVKEYLSRLNCEDVTIIQD